MAQTVGSRVKAIAVIALVAVMSFAFAIWGIEDVFSQQSSDSVLTVGDSKVTPNEFNQSYRQALRILAEEQNLTLTNEQAFARGVHMQVLNNLLAGKIEEVDADELGIGVNARTARKMLAGYEVFKDDLTGEFSVQQLDSILAMQNPRITREEFEGDLIKTLRQQQTRPVIAGGVKAPLQFAAQKFKFLTEQRRVSVLTLTTGAVPAATDPTDDDIKDYISANPIAFTAPEYRRITMVRMEPEDFVLMNEDSMRGVISEDNLKTAFNNVFVNEDRIQADYEYKVSLGELGSPATRSLIQISANSEDNAKEIATKLKEGLLPEEIITLYGLIEPITYDGVIADSILDPETAKAAFEMENGDIRSFMGGFGSWVTVQVTEAVAEVKPSIETVRDEILTSILTSEASDRIYDKMAALQTELDEGRTLEEAADTVGLPYSTIDFMDRSGTTQHNDKLDGLDRAPGIARDEEILKTIFTADLNFETDYFDTSTGGQAIIRVDGLIESQPRPFEDVRDQAAEYLKLERTEEALNDLMLDLASKAADGETLETLAAGLDKGASVGEFMLNRRQPNPQIGTRIIIDILDAKEGDLKRGIGPNQLIRQIAKLEEIIANEEVMPDEVATIVQDQVTAELIKDLDAAYRQAVVQDHPYVQYPDRIKQLLGVNTDAE